MKSTPIVIALSFFLMDVSFAAVPGMRDSSEIIFPDDSVSTTSRGGARVCGFQGGKGRPSLKFMQFDKMACPGEPQKSLGWDRPQVEPLPPGIPFQDQGIERY